MDTVRIRPVTFTVRTCPTDDSAKPLSIAASREAWVKAGRFFPPIAVPPAEPRAAVASKMSNWVTFSPITRPYRSPASSSPAKVRACFASWSIRFQPEMRLATVSQPTYATMQSVRVMTTALEMGSGRDSSAIVVMSEAITAISSWTGSSLEVVAYQLRTLVILFGATEEDDFQPLRGPGRQFVPELPSKPYHCLLVLGLRDLDRLPANRRTHDPRRSAICVQHHACACV